MYHLIICALIMFAAPFLMDASAQAEEIVMRCEWSNHDGSFDLSVSESRVLLDGARIASASDPLDQIDVSRDYISIRTIRISGFADKIQENYRLKRKPGELTYDYYFAPMNGSADHKTRTASCADN